MEIKMLLKEIPTQAQYSLKVDYFGFRYSCTLEINNGTDSIKITGSSHELEKAFDVVYDSLKSQLKLKMTT